MQQGFIIIFHDQADTRCACQNGIQETGGSASPGPGSANGGKLFGRGAVLRALQAVASQTETALKPLVDQLAAAGQISCSRHFYVINAMAVTASQDAVDALALHPAVAQVLPDRVVSLEPAPAESPASGHGERPWGVEHIGAPLVWAMGHNGTGVVVGMIDTGVEYTHPALQRKFRGYNPANPSLPATEGNWFDAVAGNAAAPYDDNHHGTHVAGIVLGSAPDGSDPVGVAPGARWIAAKAFDAAGEARSSWLLAAGEWMLAPRDAREVAHPKWAPDLINNSWGGGPGIDEWYRPMVANWRTAGIFPVFAVGNNGPESHTVTAPGNYPEAFAVGAIDPHDRVARFSARGPSPYGETKPELVAPGVGIRSAMPGGGFGLLAGTSMAAPHVSGTVALLVSARPDLSVDEMEQLLAETAVPLTGARSGSVPNNSYGYGLVNAFDAVCAALGQLGAVDGQVFGLAEGQPVGAPLAAQVRVLETGRTAQADSHTGTFHLRHGAGTWTLEAAAPGYRPALQSVSVQAGQEATLDFALHPLKRCRVAGLVTDASSGQGLAGVRVAAAGEFAATDDQGRFVLSLPEGSHVLRLRASGYHPSRVQVTAAGDSAAEVTEMLQSFTGVPGGELTYDDGTGEGAYAWPERSGAWAVRMSVDGLPGGAAGVTGARFRLTDAAWPKPGGDQFAVALYDSDGPEGGPGTLLAGPIPVQGRRDGNWTEVDLSALGVVVDADFYVAYLQSGTYPRVPGLCTDRNAPFRGRSWQLEGGQWQPSPAAEGNRMIRATVQVHMVGPIAM